jgi:drug/metabolite transporter (DMT)-like permease
MLAFPAVASVCALSVVLAPRIAARAGAMANDAAGWIWPDARGWVLIAGISLMTAAGQVLLTYGLQHEPAGPATVATYLAVAVSIPLGIVLFGQWPDRWMLLGGAMVTGSVAVISLSSRHALPPPAGAGGGQVTKRL